MKVHGAFGNVSGRYEPQRAVSRPHGAIGFRVWKVLRFAV